MNSDESSDQVWTRPVDDAGPDPELDEAVRRALANIRERATESETLFSSYRNWTRDLFAGSPGHAFQYADTAQRDRVTLLAVLDALLKERDHFWSTAVLFRESAARWHETSDQRELFCAGQALAYGHVADHLTEACLSALDLWPSIEFDRIAAALLADGIATAAEQLGDAS